MKTPLAALEFALNRLISLDPAAENQLETLAGARIAVIVDGSPVEVEVEVGPAGVRLGPLSDLVKDVQISGTPLALLRMAHEARTSGDVSGAELKIVGDVETVQKLKRFLAAIDIDWEEQLSRYIGDAGARATTLAARVIDEWARQFANTMRMNFGEYLEEEIQAVATASELQAFAEQIDVLRDDTERLALRVERLRNVAQRFVTC